MDILIFYLVLRGLDTVEDDMEAFKGREKEKLHYLRNFHHIALATEGWTMDGVGLGDEKVLLQEFHRIGNVFRSLPPLS